MTERARGRARTALTSLSFFCMCVCPQPPFLLLLQCSRSSICSTSRGSIGMQTVRHKQRRLAKRGSGSDALTVLTWLALFLSARLLCRVVSVTRIGRYQTRAYLLLFPAGLVVYILLLIAQAREITVSVSIENYASYSEKVADFPTLSWPLSIGIGRGSTAAGISAYILFR